MSQRLYKYVADPKAIKYLLGGVVKFTPIRELNDPSELVPSVISSQVLSSLNRLRTEGYSDEDMLNLRRQGLLFHRLAPQHQAISVPATKELATETIRSPFYDQIELLEQLLLDTAKTMASKVGLLCLSQRYDSLPMWAHYAGNATGGAVEFTGLDEVFPGEDETGLLFQPIAVRYERGLRGVSFETDSHESLFLSKFDDWEYEREVRVIAPLDECQARQTEGHQLFLFEIPKKTVSRAIIGWNASDETRRLIHSFVRETNRQVEVSEIRFERGYWDIYEAAQPE